MKENKLVFVVFGIILLLFIIYFLQGVWLANQPVAQPKKATAAVSIKTYTDPANYFTLKIPSNLQTSVSVSTNTTGLKTNHPITQKIEIVTHMLDGAGVTVQVVESQPTCKDAITPNSSIAGLPANYNPVHRSYTVQTTDATYVLYTFYPGSSNLHVPVNYNSSLTQQQKSEYEKSLQAILQSFHPISSKLLSC